MSAPFNARAAIKGRPLKFDPADRLPGFERPAIAKKRTSESKSKPSRIRFHRAPTFINRASRSVCPTSGKTDGGTVESLA
jgi:hypothetical protein